MTSNRETRFSPGPVTAAVGLAAVTVVGLRRLPGRLVGAAGAARTRYEELAEHGREVLSRSNGVRPVAVAEPPEPPRPRPPVAPAPAPLPPSLAETDRTALAIEDYDHLTVPQLRSRIRRLDAVELAQLLEYETAHADRAPVVTVLRNRIAALASGPAR